MIEYLVVFEPEADGRFSIWAPDLPGCVSWGSTREEATDHIREAVELWIESAKADGEAIPAPGSSLSYVRVTG